MGKISRAAIARLSAAGLCLAAFLLPFSTKLVLRPGQLNGGDWQYGTIALYLGDILAAALLAVFFILEGRKSVAAFRRGMVLAVLDAAILVSVFFAPDRFLAASFYAHWLLAAGLGFLAARSAVKTEKLAISFLSGLFLSAAYGSWQFIAQRAPAGKWLGLAGHDPSRAGESVVEAMGNLGIGERWLRACGTFDHPNILGGALAATFPLLAYFLAREFFGRRRYSILLLIYAAIVFWTAGIFFSFSRAAWIGAVIALAWPLMIAVRRRDYRAQACLLKAVFAAGLVSFFLSVAFGNLVSARVNARGRLEARSVAERLDGFRAARDSIRASLPLGLGAGNYTLRLKESIRPGLQAYAYQPVHNTYLLVALEAGAFALLALAFLLLKMNVEIAGVRGYGYLLAGSWAAIACLLMFDHWWWSLHFGLAFSAFFYGLSLRFLREDAGDMKGGRPGLREKFSRFFQAKKRR